MSVVTKKGRRSCNSLYTVLSKYTEIYVVPSKIEKVIS